MGNGKPGLHILIADGHRATRRAIQSYLKEFLPTAATEFARNGVEALDMIEAEPPSIVLIAMGLPRLDGLQVTRQIRQRWPQVKIIGMAIREEQRSAFLRSGADACLVKGSAPQQLLDTVLDLQSDTN